MRPAIALAACLACSCAASTDLPGRASGLLYDEDVTCEGTDCGVPAEPFDGSAVVGEDASRFAPDGIYVYAWFWREDGRFVELEIDAPDPQLAIDDPFVEYREWDGDTLVFESDVADGDVTVDARGEDSEVAGRFSLVLEGDEGVREIHEGRFTTVPPPPAAPDYVPPTGGGGGSEPVRDHGTYDDGTTTDVYVEGGCVCVADPGPEPDPTYDSGGGCGGGSTDSSGDYAASDGGGCDGSCEGDTAPADEGAGGCSGESGGGCEGDAAAAPTVRPRGPSTLRRIWSQNFPFVLLGAGLVTWRRRARRRARCHPFETGAFTKS